MFSPSCSVSTPLQAAVLPTLALSSFSWRCKAGTNQPSLEQLSQKSQRPSPSQSEKKEKHGPAPIFTVFKSHPPQSSHFRSTTHLMGRSREALQLAFPIVDVLHCTSRCRSTNFLNSRGDNLEQNWLEPDGYGPADGHMLGVTRRAGSAIGRMSPQIFKSSASTLTTYSVVFPACFSVPSCLAFCYTLVMVRLAFRRLATAFLHASPRPTAPRVALKPPPCT